MRTRNKEGVLKALRRARHLVKYKFCRYDWAEDKNGDSANPKDDKACKFCALGAIERAAFEQGLRPSTLTTCYKVFSKVFGELDTLQDVTNAIMSTNDSQGQQATIELFDKAIVEAKKLKQF